MGFSCMSYEISGALGIKMANPDKEVISFVGDGSYLLNNTDIYSSVITKNKLIIICLLYTSPSPRDKRQSRMPSSA